MTAADDAAGLMIDLAYGLALDDDGRSDEGLYADPLPTGARISLTDETDEIVHYLTSAECVRVGRYLLACGEANR